MTGKPREAIRGCWLNVKWVLPVLWNDANRHLWVIVPKIPDSMLHHRPLFAACVAFAVSAVSNAQTEFQKFISAPSGDTLSTFRFHPTSDGGGYGWMALSGAPYQERVIRFNGSGVPLWNKSLHFAASPTLTLNGKSGLMDDDGLLLSSPADWSLVDQDSIVLHQTILKCDTTGALLWSKRYAQPVVTPAMFYGIKRFDALATGAEVVTNHGFGTVGVGDISHLCIATDGTALWSSSWQTTFNFCPSALELATAATADSGLVVAVSCGLSNGVIEVCKFDDDGQMLWHKTIDVSNAPWKAGVSSMVADPNGGVLVTGRREAGQLDYDYAIWLDANGIIHRHQWEPDQRYAIPMVWTTEGIWQSSHWGWTRMDTTGSFIDRTFELLPGWWNAPIWRTIVLNTEVFSSDSLWLAGYHREQDTQFGYTEERPFLIKSALDPLAGCNFIDLPNQPINYIEPPDSLVDIVDLPLVTPVAASVMDTAMITVDHPTNTTYDFCTLVSVQEQEVSTSMTVSPVPASDHLVFDVPLSASGFGSWMILDLSGRAVQAGQYGTGARQQVDITSLSAGTYLLRCSSREKRSSARFIKQ